jgi:hypothetical protein
LNGVWANTGLTIHQILQKATRLKEQFGINPDTLKIDNLNGENLTYIKQKELVDLAHTLESIYKQVAEQTQSGCIQNHYWYGVEKYDLNSYQITELIDSLDNWSESLHELGCSWKVVLENIDGYKVDSDSLSEIEQYVHSGLQLPQLMGGEQLDELDLLFENKTEVDAVLDAYVIIHKKIESLQEDVFDDALVTGVTSNTIADIIKSLKSFGVSYSMDLGSLSNDKVKLEK